jgi:hypothetical protein
MTKDEALKLALEALQSKHIVNCGAWRVQQDQAITAIKEALAQPEQHQDWCASLTQMLMSMPPKPAPCNCNPLKREWVGLTDAQWQIFADTLECFITRKQKDIIEAKLKEQNT